MAHAQVRFSAMLIFPTTVTCDENCCVSVSLDSFHSHHLTQFADSLQRIPNTMNQNIQESADASTSFPGDARSTQGAKSFIFHHNSFQYLPCTESGGLLPAYRKFNIRKHTVCTVKYFKEYRIRFAVPSTIRGVCVSESDNVI